MSKRLLDLYIICVICYGSLLLMLKHTVAFGIGLTHQEDNCHIHQIDRNPSQGMQGQHTKSSVGSKDKEQIRKMLEFVGSLPLSVCIRLSDMRP